MTSLEVGVWSLARESTERNVSSVYGGTCAVVGGVRSSSARRVKSNEFWTTWRRSKMTWGNEWYCGLQRLLYTAMRLKTRV